MAKSYLVYGPTGVGKTAHFAAMAKWLYESAGLYTRLITCDLGGIGTIEREGLIKAGIVKHLNLGGDSPKTLANWRRVSRGWWPKAEMEAVTPKDADGVVIGDPVMTKVVRLREDKEALQKIGLIAVENATTLSEQLMRHLVKQEVTAEDGKVSAIGPQGASGRYEEDGEVVGGNSKGHYNIVQIEMYGLFGTFSSLPDHILVGWSAHEGKGTNRRTGETMLVPQLAGEAKNHLVPTWVGDCFHLMDKPEIRDNEGNVTQAKEVRAYYANHMDDESGLYFRAKSRVALSDLPALEKRFPGGYLTLGIGPNEGLDQYFRFIESRGNTNYDALMEWKKKVDAARKVG